MQQRRSSVVSATALLTVCVAFAVIILSGPGSAPASGQAPDRPFALRVPMLAADSAAQPAPPVRSFEVLFLDVGQGDAILVTVAGERLLIDAGRSSSLALQRLQAHGVTDLDAILMTHPDADHIGGFEAVLAAFDVERIYLNGGTSSSQTFARFIDAVEAEGAEVVTPRRGQSLRLGGLDLPVLHPGAPLSGDGNDDSLVVRLSCGTVDVLFTGDAEAGAEASMLAAGVVSDIDVLKVGHHGSNTSSTAPFLQATKPEVAVISAGKPNQFGHPHAEVLARLAAVSASVVATDTSDADDSLLLKSDCASYTFESTGEPGATPTATPTATTTPTSTASATPSPTAVPTSETCHPSYPTVCVPPPPPDLNCGDIPFRNFPVVGSDPHRLDGDGDGVGCES